MTGADPEKGVAMVVVIQRQPNVGWSPQNNIFMLRWNWIHCSYSYTSNVTIHNNIEAWITVTVSPLVLYLQPNDLDLPDWSISGNIIWTIIRRSAFKWRSAYYLAVTMAANTPCYPISSLKYSFHFFLEWWYIKTLFSISRPVAMLLSTWF
jgi:hypothetical protein